MPRNPKQYDTIRKEKKHLIMAAALELFAENGYHATTISQIAQKAGISKGLSYNYFESKQAILDELIIHGLDQIFSHLDLDKNDAISETEFVYFIKQNFKLLNENMQHWKLFYALMLQPKVAENFMKDYIEKTEPFFKMLAEFIQSNGSTDLEGDLIAISSMLEGAFLYCVVAPEIFPREIMQEKIINACFKIIKYKNED